MSAGRRRPAGNGFFAFAAFAASAVTLLSACSGHAATAETRSIPVTSSSAENSVSDTGVQPTGPGTTDSFIYDTGAYLSGHLVIVDHGRAHAVRLPYSNVFGPFPNHAGKLIAFDESGAGPDKASVAVMKRDGSDPHVIPGTQGCFPGPWFPDDTRLVLNCGPGTSPPWQVRFASANGMLAGGFTNPLPGSSPFLSPDGQRLAYADGTKIVVVDLNGKVLRSMTGADGFTAFLAWSRDGRRLLYAAPAGDLELRTVPASGGAPTVILKSFDTLGHATTAVYSPDGSRILISGGGDQMDNIWIADEDGSHLEVEIPTGDGSDAAWLP